MGTNYYLRHKPCPTCGNVDRELHIGKSSVGWQFSFRGYRDQNIHSYQDWLEEFKDERREIVDEYGRVHTIQEFRDNVEAEGRKDMLSNYNIANQIPQNEKERKYLNEHPDRWGSVECYWKDNEGYSFCDRE